ncbi:hypothetical protein MAPG_05092 [Magnaporthiopsis poae ATCC 64411]|uniref:Uncharacterized protein n=1 Tax=Magnaporthiopsis poae (strain ATCC 64411 / 73-15) TaxID=644358 RepID=A0A0C4DYH1_MAGP6|nr:hypothetical protein MAPG_05092 [Magnaporthiopsis poae ATCC 64411]
MKRLNYSEPDLSPGDAGDRIGLGCTWLPARYVPANHVAQVLLSTTPSGALGVLVAMAPAAVHPNKGLCIKR